MTDTKTTPQNDLPSKQQDRIWGGVGIALGVIALLLVVMVAATMYTFATISTMSDLKDRHFTFSIAGMVMSSLLRLLAMLIGAGMAFGGLVVSVMSIRHVVQVAFSKGDEGASNQLKAGLNTSSPGVTGLIFGALVIVAALYKSSDHKYGPEEAPPAIQIPTAEEVSAGVKPAPLAPSSTSTSRIPSSAEVAKGASAASK